MNGLIALVVALLLVGLLLWAVKAAPFIDDGIKKIINIVIIVVVVLWLISIFFGGGSASFPGFHLNN